MGDPRWAIILKLQRSGGTFLACCLSNHSQIHCIRGEPLDSHSVWRKAFGKRRVAILETALRPWGYDVAMCKLIYDQAFQKTLWNWLKKKRALIVHLFRENVLRQAASIFAAKEAQKAGQARHTFDVVTPQARFEIEPDEFLERCRGLRKRVKFALAQVRASGLPCLEVAYESMIGDDGSCIVTSVAQSICQFLGVGYEPLCSDLKEIDAYPLREVFTNWKSIKTVIERSGYAEFLEQET